MLSWLKNQEKCQRISVTGEYTWCLVPKRKLSPEVPLNFSRVSFLYLKVFIALPKKLSSCEHCLWRHMWHSCQTVRMFMKSQANENKYGSDLTSVDCTTLNLSGTWGENCHCRKHKWYNIWSAKECLAWNTIILRSHRFTSAGKITSKVMNWIGSWNV